jgi:hypothetical protein
VCDKGEEVSRVSDSRVSRGYHVGNIGGSLDGTPARASSFQDSFEFISKLLKDLSESVRSNQKVS